MVKNGWYYCECGQKLFKVLPTTKLIDYPSYCKKCHTEKVINVLMPMHYGIPWKVKEGEQRGRIWR